MGMIKHSPEWHKTDDGRLVCYPPGLEAGILSKNLPEGELEANERLILAAPDMLKALRQLRDAAMSLAGHPSVPITLVQPIIDACDAADAAITKAEGKA